MRSHEQIGYEILRLGLAVVILWFGYSQLVDTIAWISWVPDWSVQLFHIPPAMIVLLNGLFEVIAGTLLAMNIFMRPVTILLALHMAFITFDIGLTAIGVRDLGLATALTALAFFAYSNHANESITLE